MQYNPMGNPVYPQQFYQQPVQQQVIQDQNNVNPQVFHANAQQPQQQQQPTQILTPEEFRKQVDELAEAKFKARAADVTANAIAAMKGVMNNMGLFDNNEQQQQPQGQQQQSFFNTTWGKVAIGGAGIGVGVVGTKMAESMFGGKSGYTPSSQEINLVGQALKTLFG